MATLIDNTGTAWHLHLDSSAEARVRRHGYEPSLLRLGVLQRVFNTAHLRFVVFVFLILEPEARARGIDAAGFWRRVADRMPALCSAFNAAVADWARTPRPLDELQPPPQPPEHHQ